MAYRVHIRQFDGPLDLLLHLIGRAEIDIADIFVSEITQQYLSYMDQLDEVDMDTASDFLAMAATLLYIKSRHLLPRPPRLPLPHPSPLPACLRRPFRLHRGMPRDIPISTASSVSMWG